LARRIDTAKIVTIDATRNRQRAEVCLEWDDDFTDKFTLQRLRNLSQRRDRRTVQLESINETSEQYSRQVFPEVV
jgi:hypothetical protein